jgi:electron transfer flavoprotein alpha subunit
MKCEILVIAEHNEGGLDSITLDLIAWGSIVAGEKRWAIGVLVLGLDLHSIVNQLSSAGLIDHVFVIDDPQFEIYNSSVYVPAIATAIREIQPELVLTAHSYTGIEIAAGLAPLLGAPLVANCHSIEASGNGFLVTRSAFAGRFFATVPVSAAVPFWCLSRNPTRKNRGEAEFAGSIAGDHRTMAKRKSQLSAQALQLVWKTSLELKLSYRWAGRSARRAS